MGDMSSYGKIIRNFLGSMKPPSSNLCAAARPYESISSTHRQITAGFVIAREAGITSFTK